jgi:hypothetical protein
MATEQEIIIKIGAQDNASATMQQINDELEGVAKQLAALESEGKQASKAFEDLTAKQKQLTEQSQAYEKLPLEDKLNITKKRMIELAAAGKQNTDEFRSLAAEAGKMKRSIEGVEQTVQTMSMNGTKGMAIFSEAVTAISAGMAVAQGAAGLFGEQNEDLERTMIKVQSAMSLAMGVQQLTNVLTQKSILLTEAYAAAQKLLAWTTAGATTSIKAMRVALVSTGVGALIVALGLLVEALISTKDETEDTTDAMIGYNKAMEKMATNASRAEEKLGLLQATMKANGATEIQITKAIRDNLAARQEAMILDEQAAKQQVDFVKTRLIALRAEANGIKYTMEARKEANGFEDRTYRSMVDKHKAMRAQIQELTEEVNKAEGEIKSSALNRQKALIEANTAYKQAAANEQRERNEIAQEAAAALMQENERELIEFDKNAKEKISKLKAGSEQRAIVEAQFAEQRKRIIERQNQDVAEADKNAESQRLASAIAAEDTRINALIAKAKTSGKSQEQIAAETESLEIQRIERQIQLTKEFCQDTSELEAQLQETLKTNKQNAYARELEALEKQNDQRTAAIMAGAKSTEEATAMQTAAELQNLEAQLELAKKYGYDTIQIEAQISQIKLQTTDALIQDGKRRLEAATGVQRQLEAIGKTERQVAKQERQNALKDSEKAFQDDSKMYKTMLEAGLITEQDYGTALNELREERRNRDLAAETAYREKLKGLQSTYAVQEIQYAQQAINALTQMRSTELERAAQAAEYAKEDEILQLDMQLKAQLITQEFYEQQKASVIDKYDKEAEAYERRKFELDKAAAISNALVSTYLAGVQVLAATKGGTIARFIAMAATITAGLAQVSTIASQKFRGRTAGKMSATASLPTPEPSQPNQLISNPQTTNLGGNGQSGTMGAGGQGGTQPGAQGNGTQPVRAYVVERDITETEQRVRQISQFATLS